MASPHHPESPKTQLIVTQFLSKTLHTILQSRSPNYSGAEFTKTLDKWFHLALHECPAALDNLDRFRRSNLDPMIVDLLLANSSKDDGELRSERVIERWIVQYERSKDPRKLSKRGGGGTSSQSVYKKLIILLRSLYLTVRILPAYRLYRDLNSSRKVHAFGIAHRVSSFVEPFTDREEAEMCSIAFTPVETACGRLCISVLYSPALSVGNVESSTPMSPRFIPDYVGSPLTSPLKRFSSIPRPGLDSQRSHSWSYDALRNFPPSMSSSPSPTFPDSLGNVAAFPSNHGPPLSRGAKLDTSSDTYNAKARTKIRDVPSEITNQKTNPLGKDEIGNLSGAKLSSHNSLRISCSRSFGKFSFQDDFDESDFCPFAVNDIGTTKAHIRTGSFDGKEHISERLHHGGSLPVKKSQDAAVGYLVNLLKTAPPLRQVFSNSTISQASKPAIPNQNTQEPEQANSKEAIVRNSISKIGITSPGRIMLKTTSEALEELKGYRDMKEKLLKQGCNISSSADTGGM